MKTTYLITGSNGLLGQKLVYALADKPHVELIATSVGDNRLEMGQGYTYSSMDITREEEVQEVFEKYHPEVVIHTAAMTQVDQCQLHQQQCHAINALGTRNVVQAAEKVGAYLVHLSTDFVFDGEQGDYVETDETNPVSFYGETKVKAEQYVLQSNLRAAIIRTVLVYGVTENLSRSNIVLWAKGALERGEKINVVNDQVRTPTLVEDLASACVAVAGIRAEGIFHVSGKDRMSVIEIAQAVARYFQLDESLIHPIASKDLNQPANRPPRTGFWLDKATVTWGYNPRSFQEGLQIVADQLDAMKAGVPESDK